MESAGAPWTTPRQSLRRYLNPVNRSVRNGWFAVYLLVVGPPVWVGFVMSIDGNIFNDTPSFRVMPSVMPRFWWAMFSCFTALVGGASWFMRSSKMWVLANWTLAVWHSLVALCIFQANPVDSAVGIYAVLTIGAALRMVGQADALRHD